MMVLSTDRSPALLYIFTPFKTRVYILPLGFLDRIPLSLWREELMYSLYIRLQTPSPSAIAPLLKGVLLCPAYWPYALVVTSVFCYLRISFAALLPFEYNNFGVLWEYPLL